MSGTYRFGGYIQQMARCPWADTCPLGLSDAAEEGWAMTKLNEVFARAHARSKNHDDGSGHCRVCGGPIDFEGWMNEQDALEARNDPPGE